ncbi:MAG: hypothetical protein WBL63_12945 [Candidatus Acidiferrum sp.]
MILPPFPCFFICLAASCVSIKTPRPFVADLDLSAAKPSPTTQMPIKPDITAVAKMMPKATSADSCLSLSTCAVTTSPHSDDQKDAYG